jgi:hypothetical protein
MKRHGGAELRRYPAGIAWLRAGALLLALFQGTAGGQEPDAPLPGPPRYTVELIVFTYNDASSAGSEIFVPDRPPPDEYRTADPDSATEGDAGVVFGDRPDQAVSDIPPPDGGAATADPQVAGEDGRPTDAPLRERIELRLLEPDEYTMDAIHAELVRLDAYHPILRAAWTQTALPQEVSPAVQLRALAELPPGLDGSVTLYQGRFVHLGLDLTLDAEPGDDAGAPADARRSATDRAIAYGDARVQGQAARDDGLFDAPLSYHISESRIVKDGDIRYYDHPRFGVLAKVTEAGNEVPEQEPSSAIQ